MTYFNWKPNRNENITKKEIFILFSGIIVVGLILSYFDWKRSSEMESYKITWGVVVDESTNKNGQNIFITYFIDEQQIKSSRIPVVDCAYKKHVGDTVIIKYSTINNQTIDLKECYWNDNLKKKYGFYK